MHFYCVLPPDFEVALKERRKDGVQEAINRWVVMFTIYKERDLLWLGYKRYGDSSVLVQLEFIAK
jgi:hypothetical protein